MSLPAFLDYCLNVLKINTTQAVELATCITGASSRTVWGWHTTGKLPAYAARLLHIWAEATPEQRARWFSF